MKKTFFSLTFATIALPALATTPSALVLQTDFSLKMERFLLCKGSFGVWRF